MANKFPLFEPIKFFTFSKLDANVRSFKQINCVHHLVAQQLRNKQSRKIIKFQTLLNGSSTLILRCFSHSVYNIPDFRNPTSLACAAPQSNRCNTTATIQAYSAQTEGPPFFQFYIYVQISLRVQPPYLLPFYFF